MLDSPLEDVQEIFLLHDFLKDTVLLGLELWGGGREFL
jgi:hypothetical protein